MFTGLIEAVGSVVERRPLSQGQRLSVHTDLVGTLTLGDSLAINGVCLTISGIDDRNVHVDISPETERVSTLGELPRGTPVNLERPIRLDGALGGHFVQGHVDGTGHIVEIQDEAEFRRLTISFPRSLAANLVPKGSIAVDGISLTIAALEEDTFDVQIVPFTWTHTNLHASRIGLRVNLEGDLIGKYVTRAAELAGLRPIG